MFLYIFFFYSFLSKNKTTANENPNQQFFIEIYCHAYQIVKLLNNQQLNCQQIKIVIIYKTECKSKNCISQASKFIMGGSSSKEEGKTENSGAVQNNITVGKTMEVHNTENSILLGIICAIKVLEILIYLYKSFRRSLKRNLNTGNRAMMSDRHRDAGDDA